MVSFCIIYVFSFFFIFSTRSNDHFHYFSNAYPIHNAKKIALNQEQVVVALFDEGMHEGDILIRRRKPANQSFAHNSSNKLNGRFEGSILRNAVPTDDLTWPGGVIPYHPVIKNWFYVQSIKLNATPVYASDRNDLMIIIMCGYLKGSGK